MKIRITEFTDFFYYQNSERLNEKSMEMGIRILALAFPWDIIKTVLVRVDKRLIEDFLTWFNNDASLLHSIAFEVFNPPLMLPVAKKLFRIKGFLVSGRLNRKVLFDSYVNCVQRDYLNLLTEGLS